MSGVVLRCPTCGTNGTHAGECDACGDDEVRYYCGNHEPGLWLDNTICSSCGAKFGDLPKPQPKPPTPRSTRHGERDVRPPVTPVRPERSATPPVRKRPPYPKRPEPIETEEEPSVLDLVDWIAEEMKARGAFTPPSREPPPVERPPPAPGLPLKGCIVRFLIFVLILFALAVGAVVLLAGGGLAQFVTDVGQSTGLVTGTPEQTTRGIEAFRSGNLELAQSELSQAAATYPRSALALLYLAKMRADSGDLVQSAEYLREAARREPNSFVVRREVGLGLLAKARSSARLAGGQLSSSSDLIEAERHLAIAATLSPDDRLAIGYRGCALAELGAESAAMILFSKAGDGPWNECRHIGTVVPQ